MVLAVRRAASDLAAVEAFYRAMNTTVALVVDEGSVSARCFLWTSASVDVCFVERASNATRGPFTVKQMEDMLDATHDAVLGGGGVNCGRDKWADNHYAYDAVATVETLPGDDTVAGEATSLSEGNFDYILDYLEVRGRVCACSFPPPARARSRWRLLSRGARDAGAIGSFSMRATRDIVHYIRHADCEVDATVARLAVPCAHVSRRLARACVLVCVFLVFSRVA